MIDAERLLALPSRLRRREELRACLAAAGALDRLPPDEQARCKDAYRAAAAFNLPRVHRLAQLAAAAQAAGVRLVALKGAALIATHYRDPGARPMIDVDVVCAPEDVARVLALGGELGLDVLGHPEVRTRRGLTHDLKLVAPSVTIEVHFRLWHELGLDGDPAGLIARAAEGPGGLLVPSPADHLYVVLVHAALHGFTGNPMWLVDAALLAEDAPDAWTGALALASRAGATLPLLAARDHLVRVLPGVLPDDRGPAPLRRALLRSLAPVLQLGEARLGPWGSRLVRPLLVRDARTLARLVRDKAAVALAGQRA